ncbi:MAG: hypothetical protein KA995_06820 [Paludibacteraceae bacterium]|nr:hypothetical protein [Paludibacteraceae bacterium]
MKKWLFMVLLIVTVNTVTTSANDDIVQDKSLWKHYFMPSVGIELISFRDLATSPLFYDGVGLAGNIAWQWERPKNETNLAMYVTSGSTSSRSPISNFFQSGATSSFLSGSLYAHSLFTLPSLSNEELILQLGGAMANTWNIRSNPSLFNNGFGMESFANLFLSGKGIYDISRKHSVVQDFVLFTRTLQPAKRNISLQLNIGLLNLNYRPGYAYNADVALDGTNTDPLAFLLDGHVWKINGYRLGTQLDYTKYIPNGNGHRWSYIWDIAQAPGRFEPFEMVTHRIQYTLLIQTK